MSGVTLTNNANAFRDEMADRVDIALEMCGQLAERYAQMLAPEDTGLLINSIHHAQKKNTEYIGTDVWYAPYQEYGTINMRAHSFLRPAIIKHEYEYREIVRQVLTRQ